MEKEKTIDSVVTVNRIESTYPELGIAELCPDGLLVVRDAEIVYANPAAARLLCAVSADEIGGTSLSSLLNPASQEEFGFYLAGLAGPHSVSSRVELQGTTLIGTPLELEIAGALVRWDGDEAALLVARDVKERRVTDTVLTAVGAELAARVSERTADLAGANDALRASVTRRDRLVAERNDLLKSLALAEEAERRKLSRDLHDQVGQHLTALALGLRALANVVPEGSDVDRRAKQLQKLTGSLGRELHSIAVQLRPKTLDDFGLGAALATYVEQWIRQTGIHVDLHIHGGSERFPVEIEDNLFRMSQEALTNILKHSGATLASIEVKCVDGVVHAIIEDNGHGFDVGALAMSNKKKRGIGLLGMSERAALVDGDVEIESTSRGTTLFIRVPLKSPNRFDDAQPERSQ